MNQKPKRQLIVQPLACRSAAIGRALWTLEDARRRTLEDLQGIPEDAIDLLDWISPLNGNSLGSLLYHLAVVEADWLYTEVLEQNFSPEVQALLPLDMRDSQKHLTMLPGLCLADHLERLAQIRHILRDVYADMTLTDSSYNRGHAACLLRQRHPQFPG